MRWLARLGLLIGAVAALAAPAAAQSWPSKPVKIVVPFGPGGPADIYARILGQELTEALKQQFVIENKAGAGGTIGADIVAKAAPDGYTLLMMSNTLTTNETLLANKPYMLMRDLVAVAPVNSSDLVMVVSPSVQAKTLSELIALAKAQPGRLTYASSGPGGAIHLASELFKREAGVDIVHIPYKGAGPAVTDLLSGQIQMMMVTPLLVEPHARAGKLKLIAAATPQRIAALPDLPTIAESGVPGYEAGTWFALMGPAGMPRELVAAIYGDVMKILNDHAFRERYVTKQWFEVVGNPPGEFAEYLKSEYQRWDRLIRLSGVKVE